MAHTPAFFPWALTEAAPDSERNSVLFPDPVFPKIPTSTVPPLPYRASPSRLRRLGGGLRSWLAVR